tara:strand:- start:2282 stop:2488 length:207 start_codon:yes stop_codon:yes gene_type:complete
MLDLNYEGRNIHLWPGNTVEKWAKIEHVTEQGMVIEFTEVRAHGYQQHYHVGDIMFLPWDDCKFIFTD